MARSSEQMIWGLAPMTDANRRDLLEIIDDRYHQSSTLITSQLPVQAWHDSIGDATLGDAILDRLIHNSHQKRSFIVILKHTSLRSE